MPKLRNVIIPLDGSPHADRGILPGKRLAAAFGLGVGVMEVVSEPNSSGHSFLDEAVQKEHLDANREMVEKLSEGRLGYIHVSRMQWNEFIKWSCST